MTEPIANERFPYFSEEHEMLRRTIRRFIADKVLPVGGRTGRSRASCRARCCARLGSLGLLGMRYAPEYGGAGLDTLANAVLAEELGRSTYGGAADARYWSIPTWLPGMSFTTGPHQPNGPAGCRASPSAAR